MCLLREGSAPVQDRGIQMILIDKLCYQSKLRYVNATEKFVYAVLSLVFCIVSRSAAAAVLVFLANGILTVGKGKIPLSHYIKLLLVPAAFLLLGTAAMLIDLSRAPMDAFAFRIGEWYLTGSTASLTRVCRLWITALSAVTCLYFLSLNTTMTDILEVLRKMRLPALLIELMMLIYRFIFLLLETASAIMTAQESRLGNRDYRTKVRSFGAMASALFVQSMRRSDALYDALESRCYDGTIRVLSQERPAKKKEIVGIALFESLLLLITIWSIIE